MFHCPYPTHLLCLTPHDHQHNPSNSSMKSPEACQPEKQPFFDTVLARKGAPTNDGSDVHWSQKLDGVCLPQSGHGPDNSLGLHVGQVKVIFSLPPKYGKFREPLIYVEWFTPLASARSYIWDVQDHPVDTPTPPQCFNHPRPSATWQRTYFLCHLFSTYHSSSGTYITIFGNQLLPIHRHNFYKMHF